jgi:hypothetical protein
VRGKRLERGRCSAFWDRELNNGVHFADFARRVDVPESKLAFGLRQQQIRYLAVTPKRTDAEIKQIGLAKGKATPPRLLWR